MPTIILSPNRYKYAKRCEATLKLLKEDLKFTNVRVHESALTPGSQRGGCKGFLDIFTNVLSSPDMFQPFIVVEDDVMVYGDDPEFSVRVPKDADLLYLGISKCGAQPLKEEFCMTLLYENVPAFPRLKRVYNMLGMHAILFLNQKAVEELHRRLSIQYHDHPEGHWDMRAARYQSQGGRVYALSKPLFYQSKILGGQQDVTNCELPDAGQENKPPECGWFV